MIVVIFAGCALKCLIKRVILFRVVDINTDFTVQFPTHSNCTTSSTALEVNSNITRATTCVIVRVCRLTLHALNSYLESFDSTKLC